MKNQSNIQFHPMDIQFNDDARHRTGNFSLVETWYYDAIFDNGYSIVSLINVIHFGKIGKVLSGIFFYKDGKLIKLVRKRYPLKSFYGSENTVQLKLNNREILSGNNKLNGLWTYQLKRGDDHFGFDLQFLRTMKPFKGKTYLGNWLVIPSFSVSGTLIIEGDSIQVTGTGYHDHNQYPLRAPFVTKGYFFGKIPLGEVNLIWARVQKKKSKIQTLAILCKNESFLSINPKYIKFSIDETKSDQRKTMPYRCRIKVNDKDLNLDVRFKPINFHYLGIPATKYWRYHMGYNGYYIIDNTQRSINEIDIAEYLSFF